MNPIKRPTLCVIAGPNGSGKTSTTVQLLKNEWSEGSLYINPDNIAQEQYGDWNSTEAILKAAKQATELRYKCLSDKTDFVFETVFSSNEKLDFLRKAHEEGFFIRFFYVCTENPEINVSRIAKRYLDGGHEVPISKIISRYYKSLINASEAISFVDRAYIYDNSVENQLPRLLFRTYESLLTKQYTIDIPAWAKEFLPQRHDSQKYILPDNGHVMAREMPHLSKEEHDAQMADMKSFDEPMPQVGIFWYDSKDKTFFGVRKQELTPKQVEEASDQGLPFINYPHLHRQVWAKEFFKAQVKNEVTKFTGDYTQIPRGRVAWNINKFIVFVGQWAKPIEAELSTMIEKEFALPYFEFVYDYHWDLGHGWSGDMYSLP